MENEALIIRKAHFEDIPIIQQIAHNTWPSAYSNIISQEQIDFMLGKMYDTSLLEKEIQGRHVYFIAYVAENPIGFAAISPQESEKVYKLNKLYVLPDTHKKGVGKALLQTAIGAAKEAYAIQLILQVNRANPATQFYLKQGFSIIDNIDFHFGEGYYMNDYIMQKIV